MKDRETKKKYDLDLQRFSSNRRGFPWTLVIRSVLGILLTLLVVYFMQQMITAKNEQGKDRVPKEEIREFGIEIGTDSI